MKARVEQIHAFSGHTDRSGLRTWISHFRPPRPVLFLTHGERNVALGLAASLRKEIGYNVSVPRYQDLYELKSSGNS